MRAAYLVGSRADGSHTPLSDIDLRLVLAGEFASQAEQERFLQARQACRDLSPLPVDCPPLSEQLLIDDLQWLHESINIQANGLLLYGEDIRQELPTPQFSSYLANVTQAPLIFFSQMHRQDPLLYPLNYPDGEDQFYGYVQYPDHPETPIGGTKRLVHILGFAATCLIGLSAGQMVLRKKDWLPVYRQAVGDAWTPYLEQIYTRLNVDWGYQLPAGKSEQRTLRGLCRKALEFENHYLEVYRGYLLNELDNPDGKLRQMAISSLNRIRYPDQEFRQAVRRFIDKPGSRAR